ncbi:glycoside hydrolase family 2 protein [Arundinibacter roseus]|uniref:Beta-galactosidase n=1 Tax=Arundinibacter roseus TaxID=2070510 RepID=A0A4R4JUL4_9BACT|nr:glycoside hydrolase family 2 TIM barrel-domain containing protein [Arundinibacter roseus]TDB58233.1 beta-galactosidase [Arundinibacter roseus]
MKKTTLLFALQFLCSSLLLGQYSIKDPGAIPLNGDWSFTLDPAEMGVRGGWFSSKVPTSRFDKVTVPHCFSVDPRYQFFTGTVWYRKNFSWKPQPNERVILHFDAAYYQTDVWLNEQKVGEHEGGYTPFHFDITDLLKSGENLLSVSVNNNTWKPGSIPGAKDNDQPNDPFMGWMNYGGLNRPVYLTVEPDVYIENLKVEPTPDLANGTARLLLKVRVRNATNQVVSLTPAYTVSFKGSPISLKWKENKPKISAGQTGILEAETTLTTAQVKLWNLDQPNLYQVQVAVGKDTIRSRFGIRKVEVKNAQLLLNGQPMRLAGGNRVVDYPGLGALEPDWLIEKDFRLMKEAGMEFQRLTHYTPSERFYDLADSLGMLIITEAGNWQLTPRQMDADSLRTKFKQQFTEMMERDWNHPSVIAYSVGNEYLSEQPAGQRWTKDMIEWARTKDNTRLYTFASMRLNILPKNPEDEASQYVDFVSTNTYGNHAKSLDHIHKLYPDKPILISEWGRRADAEGGEQKQAEHIEEIARLARERPYVVGASWWTYNDYQSRYAGTNANGYRPWGIVGPTREPRPAFFTHQKEMAPLTLQLKSVEKGSNGTHQLVVTLTGRADFPAYTMLNYTLEIDNQRVVIPSLNPGESKDVKIPIRGFEQELRAVVRKPTGFVILEKLLSLKE